MIGEALGDVAEGVREAGLVGGEQMVDLTFGHALFEAGQRGQQVAEGDPSSPDLGQKGPAASLQPIEGLGGDASGAGAPAVRVGGQVILDVGEQAGVPVLFPCQFPERFGYAEAEDAQTLRLPYQGGDLAMVVFLPRKKTGLPDLEKTLAAKPLSEWWARLPEQEVQVYLPRFKMETAFSLVAPLHALGVGQAFNEKLADFSRMIDPVKGKGEAGLFITAAFHKAFVAVDEEGTEAAAATAVVMGTRSMRLPPQEFRADHPFLFCIVHEPTGAVLFLGRVTKPAS